MPNKRSHEGRRRRARRREIRRAQHLHGNGGGGPSRVEELRDRRCPDCEYEGRLQSDGRARVRGGSFAGATRYVGAIRATWGCETCRGTGRVPLDSPCDY
jgi:hypothetical protein